MSATKQIFDTDAIAALEAGDVEKLRHLTLKERSELIIAACEAAATIENSRLKMGLPPTQPAPWPQSTWDFLARCAYRARTG
jgi:hypothetical protein